jgi:cystathionine beta-lyase/cystathionine gamma-synthase
VTDRPDKHDPSSLAFASQAVHAGNRVDEGSGAIRTPLVLANSYALPEDPSGISWSGTDVPLYTRNSGATQLALQEKLAALDGGEDAVALATGVAALHAVFFTFLDAGDHVVVSDVTYEATWRLFAELLPAKYGVQATFVDAADPAAVAAAMRENTRVVHVETIANPTTKVADTAYPGLPTHPQYDLATRQFGGRGYGAVISFAVDGDPAAQNRFVAGLRLITSAVSLGHDESLIVHVGTDGPRVAAYPEPFRRYGHLRFSVGLEDAADLAADIRGALDRTL